MSTYTRTLKDTHAEDVWDMTRSFMRVCYGGILVLGGGILSVLLTMVEGTHQGPPHAFFTYARYAIWAGMACALVYALYWGIGYALRRIQRAIRIARTPL